jgi:hypothetical protein
MRLIERETETEHTRSLPPVLDDIQSLFGLQIEVPENANLVRMLAHRVDRLYVDVLAQRARRMKHCRIDPGCRHLPQGVVHSIGGDLPVVRRHLGIFPKVDLRVDDHHYLPPSCCRCPRFPPDSTACDSHSGQMLRRHKGGDIDSSQPADVQPVRTNLSTLWSTVSPA